MKFRAEVKVQYRGILFPFTQNPTLLLTGVQTIMAEHFLEVPFPTEKALELELPGFSSPRLRPLVSDAGTDLIVDALTVAAMMQSSHVGIKGVRCEKKLELKKGGW